MEALRPPFFISLYPLLAADELGHHRNVKVFALVGLVGQEEVGGHDGHPSKEAQHAHAHQPHADLEVLLLRLLGQLEHLPRRGAVDRGRLLHEQPLYRYRCYRFDADLAQ